MIFSLSELLQISGLTSLDWNMLLDFTFFFFRSQTSFGICETFTYIDLASNSTFIHQMVRPSKFFLAKEFAFYEKLSIPIEHHLQIYLARQWQGVSRQEDREDKKHLFVLAMIRLVFPVFQLRGW